MRANVRLTFVIIETESIYKNDILIIIVSSNISDQTVCLSKNYRVLMKSSR